MSLPDVRDREALAAGELTHNIAECVRDVRTARMQRNAHAITAPGLINLSPNDVPSILPAVAIHSARGYSDVRGAPGTRHACVESVSSSIVADPVGITDTVLADDVGVVADAGAPGTCETAVASNSAAHTVGFTLTSSTLALETVACSSGNIARLKPDMISSVCVDPLLADSTDVTDSPRESTECVNSGQDAPRRTEQRMPGRHAIAINTGTAASETIASGRTEDNVSLCQPHPGLSMRVNEDHVETAAPRDNIHLRETSGSPPFARGDLAVPTAADAIGLARCGKDFPRCWAHAETRLASKACVHALPSAVDKKGTVAEAVDGTGQGEDTPAEAISHHASAGRLRPPDDFAQAAPNPPVPRHRGSFATTPTAGTRSAEITEDGVGKNSKCPATTRTYWSHRTRPLVCSDQSRVSKSSILRWAALTIIPLVVSSTAPSDRNGLGRPGVCSRLNARRKRFAVFAS